MGDYIKSRPRSRSTGKIPINRRISASPTPKPPRNVHRERRASHRAASEAMDKEDVTSSIKKGKRLTAPGSKRREVANSPKPPLPLGKMKKKNPPPSALASLSSIDNTPTVHRSYDSNPFGERQMKPERHHFRDIRSTSHHTSHEFEARSEKMKKMLNYYENRVLKDFAPKTDQQKRDELD